MTRGGPSQPALKGTQRGLQGASGWAWLAPQLLCCVLGGLLPGSLERSWEDRECDSAQPGGPLASSLTVRVGHGPWLPSSVSSLSLAGHQSRPHLACPRDEPKFFGGHSLQLNGTQDPVRGSGRAGLEPDCDHTCDPTCPLNVMRGTEHAVLTGLVKEAEPRVENTQRSQPRVGGSGSKDAPSLWGSRSPRPGALAPARPDSPSRPQPSSRRTADAWTRARRCLLAPGLGGDVAGSPRSRRDRPSLSGAQRPLGGSDPASCAFSPECTTQSCSTTGAGAQACPREPPAPRRPSVHERRRPSPCQPGEHRPHLAALSQRLQTP